MDVGPDLGVITSALAVPARLRMLTVLSDGRALPLCELAREAGVRPPTALSHLSKLLQAGLVVDERCGRHRYFRLPGPQVAHALETLASLAPHHKVSSLRTSLAADDLATARTCYDHLAGQVGVALHDVLLREGWLSQVPGGYALTPAGEEALGSFGLDVERVRQARRTFIRPCLDWSERTHHLGGALGAALTSHMMELDWLDRVPDSRAVRVTPTGRQGLQSAFRLPLPETNREAGPRFKVAERQAELVKADVARLVLLDDILGVVLDADLDDAAVGAGVRGLGPERLAGAARGDDERLPRDSGHLQVMEASFSHVRSFAPQVLAALAFSASVVPSEVLDAVRLLQAMNAEGRRHAPDGAPVDFVPARWRPYLDGARAAGDENRFKHYWELCVLFALQGGLRSGEIWVEGSRRYANPASYLIDAETWPLHRPEVLELTGMPATFAERLAVVDGEISRYACVVAQGSASSYRAPRRSPRATTRLVRSTSPAITARFNCRTPPP